MTAILKNNRALGIGGTVFIILARFGSREKSSLNGFLVQIKLFYGSAGLMLNPSPPFSWILHSLL
jgi:hypothetical protein